MRLSIKALACLTAIAAAAPAAQAASPFITFSESFMGNEAFSYFNYIPGGTYLLQFSSNTPVYPNSINIDNFVEVSGCYYYDSGALMGCDEQSYDRDVTAPPSGTNLQNFPEDVYIEPLPPTFYLYYPDGHLYSYADYTGLYSDIDIYFNNPDFGTVDFTLTLTPLPEPAAWAMLLGGLAAVGGVLRGRRTTPLAGAAAV